MKKKKLLLNVKVGVLNVNDLKKKRNQRFNSINGEFN